MRKKKNKRKKERSINVVKSFNCAQGVNLVVRNSSQSNRSLIFCRFIHTYNKITNARFQHLAFRRTLSFALVTKATWHSLSTLRNAHPFYARNVPHTTALWICQDDYTFQRVYELSYPQPIVGHHDTYISTVSKEKLVKL